MSLDGQATHERQPCLLFFDKDNLACLIDVHGKSLQFLSKAPLLNSDFRTAGWCPPSIRLRLREHGCRVCSHCLVDCIHFRERSFQEPTRKLVLEGCSFEGNFCRYMKSAVSSGGNQVAPNLGNKCFQMISRRCQEHEPLWSILRCMSILPYWYCGTRTSGLLSATLGCTPWTILHVRRHLGP